MKGLWKKKKQIHTTKPINLFIRYDKRRNTAINEWIEKDIDWNKLTNYQLNLNNFEDSWEKVSMYPYFLYENRLLKNIMYKKELRLIICDIEALYYDEPINFTTTKGSKIIDVDKYSENQIDPEQELRDRINDIEIKEIDHEITI